MWNTLKQGTLTYFRDLRRLTPNARKYMLGSFFIGMTFSSFLLLLNLYLRERGFGEAFIGRVLSSGAIGMTLVSIPGAVLLSRVRLKPVLMISSVLLVVFGLITINAESKFVIMGGYFCAGMMMTFYRIASAPFFMRNSTLTERPYVFSLSFGISMIAGVFGSFIFGNLVKFLASHFGYDSIVSHRVALMAGVVISLLALIPFGMLKTPRVIPKEDRLDLSWAVLNRLKGLFAKLTIPYFIVGAGAGMIVPFLNIFFRDRFGQSTDSIGYYYGLVNMTMFFGIMAGPVLVRKIGMVRSIVYTELASIPFMLVLAFSYNFPLVIAAYLFRGALMNMGQPIGTNFAMEVVPASHHGLMNALLMFAWTSSWMVSTQIGGMVIEYYGYEPSLVIAIVLYVISAVIYYFYFRKSELFTDDGITIQTDYRIT